jgi:aryl-alcohol dehydrogenase-like predicted oxidoreductase
VEYRRLGGAGLKLSVIGLGTNQLGSAHVPQAEADRIVAAALDAGINHLDTADAYQKGGSEEALGRALQGRWDRVVLATKFHMPTGDGPNDRGNSRYHILNACEASLRRLQSDHIDLYYAHRFDTETPIEETLDALADLVRQGKVRYLGASQFAAWQLTRANVLADARGGASFVALQNHYHLLERGTEGEPLDYCRSFGVGLIPFFPLAGGFLTGKYHRDQPPPAGSRGESAAYVQGYMTAANFASLERLTGWARDQGRSIGELAHAWLLAEPAVSSVISGATAAEQVLANAAAADWALSPAERAEVTALIDPA